MRISQMLTVSLFLAFLVSGSAFMLFFRSGGAVSETENRALAPLPQLSRSSVWSGAYFRQLENFAADHVAFRDTLVGISKIVLSWEGISGKDDALLILSQANNTAEPRQLKDHEPRPLEERHAEPPSAAVLPSPSGTAGQIAQTESVKTQLPEESGHLFGKVLIVGDRAMNVFTYDPAAGQAYADAINDIQDVLSSRLSVQPRFSVLLAPTAAEFIRSPKLKSLSDSQQQAIGAVYAKLKPSIRTVDVVSSLQQHIGENEPLFFRTDHHWTATGAYYGYAAYLSAIGNEPVSLTSYATEKVPGFLGSLYRATLNPKLRQHPDTIVLYKPFTKHEYVVHYSGSLPMSLLDMHHASRQNKYRIFLSGDRPWSSIKTETTGGPRLAVIKDSYGNALVPFLLPHYSEIYVVDPRQFDLSLIEFVEKHNIQELLFVNNAEVTMDSGFAGQLRKLVHP